MFFLFREMAVYLNKVMPSVNQNTHATNPMFTTIKTNDKQNSHGDEGHNSIIATLAKHE